MLAYSIMSKAIAVVSGAEEHLGLRCREMLSAAPKTVDAIARWPEPSEPHHLSFFLSQGRSLGFLNYFRRQQIRDKRFASAMQFLQVSPTKLILFIENSCLDKDSSYLSVNIGGSHSFMCTALLDALLGDVRND